MSSRKRRTGTRRSDEASRLLERLHIGLAGAEIQRVLAGSLLALDQQGRARLFEQLDDETAEALRGVLESPGLNGTSASSNPATSTASTSTKSTTGKLRTSAQTPCLMTSTPSQSG